MKNNTLKILTVGDIHGRETWKEFIFGSIERFEDWALECASGEYVRPWNETIDLIFSDIDQIIFVGDYFDSFTVSNLVMKKNVEDLFLFKRCYPEKVVLLWGNHDVHYWDRDQQCSGFRSEMFFDFNELLRNNRDYLQLAHQIGNVLWSHAGVTDSFYEKLMLEKHEEDLADHKRMTATIDGMSEKPHLSKETIADFLNEHMKMGWNRIYNVGKRRGGFDYIPGPLWADKTELLNNPLDSIFQFVGHTPVNEVQGVCDSTHGVVFVDCLEHGEYKSVVIVEITDSKFVKYEIIEE